VSTLLGYGRPMSDVSDPYEALVGARRIAVLGAAGSGKSFVATRLAEITGLRLIHLDRVGYQPGWRETDPAELIRIHCELLDESEWVIDGNYTNVGKAERIRRADLVVVLALPRRTCTRRILRRQTLNFGRGRPDMAEGCVEQFDLDFLRFCWNWHRRHPNYGEEIISQAGSTPLIVLRSGREANGFLRHVARQVG
jgi:adenylate kinase family enzyme